MERFSDYKKSLKEVERTKQIAQSLNQVVNGSLNTVPLREISGKNPNKQSQFKPSPLRKNNPFVSEPSMGNAKKTIQVSQSKKKIKYGTEGSLANIGNFDNTISLPPDGLFQGKNHSIEPWKLKNDAIPIMMTSPPIRIKGQPIFPVVKKQVVDSWMKLYGIPSRPINAVGGGTGKDNTVATATAGPDTGLDAGLDDGTGAGLDDGTGASLPPAPVPTGTTPPTTPPAPRSRAGTGTGASLPPA